MRQATNKQVNFINKLLAQHGAAIEPTTLVLEVSQGKTTQPSELSTKEAHALIGILMDGSQKDPADTMRKKLLHHTHMLGWQTTDGKADLDRVNAWCKKYGMYNKPLNEHTIHELPNLVTQFETMYLKELAL